MRDVTKGVEKYELNICNIMNQIAMLEKKVEKRDFIATFSKKNPDKIVEAIIKLQNARMELSEAMRCILDSGESKKRKGRVK